MRNTGTKHLPGDVFSTPTHGQRRGGGVGGDDGGR